MEMSIICGSRSGVPVRAKLSIGTLALPAGRSGMHGSEYGNIGRKQIGDLALKERFLLKVAGKKDREWSRKGGWGNTRRRVVA